MAKTGVSGHGVAAAGWHSCTQSTLIVYACCTLLQCGQCDTLLAQGYGSDINMACA